MRHAQCRLLPTRVALVCAVLFTASQAAAISGVCPDGSIFIVQRAEQIPCSAAKQVAPEDIPPLNPEYLPRPYGWERFNRESDPNNPYNLVDAEPPGARTTPPPQTTPSVGPGPVAPPPQTPQPTRTALAPVPAPPTTTAGVDLALADEELADLVTIVELMQERAPAAVVKRDDAGEPVVTLRLARSAALELRLRGALAAAGTPADGPIVLFTAQAVRPDAFWGNLTFVQGHVAFHPDAENPTQFGLLDGSLGPLRPEDRLIGYAVLPSHVDLAQELDIYWNDRQTTARFQ